MPIDPERLIDKIRGVTKPIEVHAMPPAQTKEVAIDPAKEAAKRLWNELNPLSVLTTINERLLNEQGKLRDFLIYGVSTLEGHGIGLYWDSDRYGGRSLGLSVVCHSTKSPSSPPGILVLGGFQSFRSAPEKNIDLREHPWVKGQSYITEVEVRIDETEDFVKIIDSSSKNFSELVETNIAHGFRKSSWHFHSGDFSGFG